MCQVYSLIWKIQITLGTRVAILFLLNTTVSQNIIKLPLFIQVADDVPEQLFSPFASASSLQSRLKKVKEGLLVK